MRDFLLSVVAESDSMYQVTHCHFLDERSLEMKYFWRLSKRPRNLVFIKLYV